MLAGYVQSYFEHRFPLIPGRDAAGVVERVGPGVEGFAPGDEVVGSDKRSFVGQGTYAQMAILPVAAACHRPESIPHDVAASLPTSGALALCVTERTDPKPGETVLIVGATGGVGGFVGQHVVKRGATVVTLNRPDHDDYARERGASASFDYAAPDLIERLREAYPDGFDVIIDLSGDRELVDRLTAVAKPGGRVASTAFAVDPDACAARGLIGMNVNEDHAHRIGEIVELITSGQLIPPQVRAYPFDQVDVALAEQAAKHVQGKLVLTIGG